MKIPIERIHLDEDIRIRKDIGNLESLQESIATVGLINPILIDEQDNLVAGYRRLCACKKLGWQQIDVRVVEFGGDELGRLNVEIAENFFRKDFSPEEILSAERRRQEIIEKNRKKGWWERLWNWLRRIFGGRDGAVGSRR
jgi:ParB family transcriptional regulator, chromosome partitioning protein